jgi:hypothetical protein
VRDAPRCWPDETVALVATGPSLSVGDLARVRGRYKVIAINDAISIAPWAEVLYSSDVRWWRRYQGVPNFRGAKFSIGRSRGRRDPIAPYDDIEVLEHTGIDGLEPLPHGLRSGEHSGYAAINLAVHFGAARLVLLGYDLGLPAIGPSHFFGRHPAGLPETTAPEFARFRAHYASLAVELDTRGIVVVNCAPTTRLEVFPVRPLAHVLDDAGAACL